MAKSTSSLASSSSATSSSVSAASPLFAASPSPSVMSPASSVYSLSPSASSIKSSASSSSSHFSSASTSTKALGLKSASSIDRRKRLAANARERKRMHLLNKAYDALRLRLIDAENKSKYDVLVQAKEYIQALASICKEFDKQNPNFVENRRNKHLYLEQQQQPQPIKTQTSPMDMTYMSSSSTISSSSSNCVVSSQSHQQLHQSTFKQARSYT